MISQHQSDQQHRSEQQESVTSSISTIIHHFQPYFNRDSSKKKCIWSVPITFSPPLMWAVTPFNIKSIPSLYLMLLFSISTRPSSGHMGAGRLSSKIQSAWIANRKNTLKNQEKTMLIMTNTAQLTFKCYIVRRLVMNILPTNSYLLYFHKTYT